MCYVTIYVAETNAAGRALLENPVAAESVKS